MKSQHLFTLVYFGGIFSEFFFCQNFELFILDILDLTLHPFDPYTLRFRVITNLNTKNHMFGFKNHMFGFTNHVFGFKNHVFGFRF